MLRRYVTRIKTRITDDLFRQLRIGFCETLSQFVCTLILKRHIYMSVCVFFFFLLFFLLQLKS